MQQDSFLNNVENLVQSNMMSVNPENVPRIKDGSCWEKLMARDYQDKVTFSKKVAQTRIQTNIQKNKRVKEMRTLRHTL